MGEGGDAVQVKAATQYRLLQGGEGSACRSGGVPRRPEADDFEGDDRGQQRAVIFIGREDKGGAGVENGLAFFFFFFETKCSEKLFRCKRLHVVYLSIGYRFLQTSKIYVHVSLLLMLHSFLYTCQVMYGMNCRFFSSGSKSHRCTRNDSSSAVPSISSCCGTTSTSTSTSTLFPPSSLLRHAVAVAHAAVAAPVTLSFTFFCFGLLGLAPFTTLLLLLSSLLPPTLLLPPVPVLALLFVPLSISTCSIMSTSASTPTDVTRPRCRCF